MHGRPSPVTFLASSPRPHHVLLRWVEPLSLSLDPTCSSVCFHISISCNISHFHIPPLHAVPVPTEQSNSEGGWGVEALGWKDYSKEFLTLHSDIDYDIVSSELCHIVLIWNFFSRWKVLSHSPVSLFTLLYRKVQFSLLTSFSFVTAFLLH